MKTMAKALGLAIAVGLLPVAAPSHGASSPAGSPAAKTVDKALFDTDDPSIVKRSGNGVCHDRKSPSFEATLHFRAYRTMKDCIDSGGRAPGK